MIVGLMCRRREFNLVKVDKFLVFVVLVRRVGVLIEEFGVMDYRRKGGVGVRGDVE